MLVASFILLFLGILAYKNFFITWSWRSVYIFTTLLNGFLSALQILLIQDNTFGLSPFLFALGDDTFHKFIGVIQFFPTTIMIVHVCPNGSEGAAYAMFTTVSNLTSVMAQAISTVLLRIWDISKASLIRGDVDGLIKLALLTTAMQVSGVLFVGFLPRTKDDLKTLGQNYRKSQMGGVIFWQLRACQCCTPLGWEFSTFVDQGGRESLANI